MDSESIEFQDWELLHPNSSSDSADSPKNHDSFDEIVHETEGFIQPNYFSIDSQTRFMDTVLGADGSEEGSVESDNPSWVDPASETRYPRKDSGGFWSDSGSERSEDRKFGEFEGKIEVGVVESSNLQVGFGGIEDKGSENGKILGELWTEAVKFESKTEVSVVDDSKLRESLKMGSENGKDLEKVVSDSGGTGLGDVKFGDLEESSEVRAVEKKEDDTAESEKRDEIVEVQPKKTGEEQRSMVWWKVPMELLKYCVFRVSPVWTFSVAAAVMGFVILGRRLYKMKRKTRGLELKVTVDDKKVSQFMSRAARLNEVFSVVKRVPMIRPQLPTPGVAPWPVMSVM